VPDFYEMVIFLRDLEEKHSVSLETRRYASGPEVVEKVHRLNEERYHLMKRAKETFLIIRNLELRRGWLITRPWGTDEEPLGDDWHFTEGFQEPPYIDEPILGDISKGEGERPSIRQWCDFYENAIEEISLRIIAAKKRHYRDVSEMKRPGRPKKYGND